MAIVAIYDNMRDRRTGKNKMGAGFCVFLLVLVFVFFTPAPIKAGTIIFNDLGSGGVYNPSSGWCITGASTSDCGPETLRMVASSFTPSANYDLTQVDMALQTAAGTNQIVVSLETNSGGLPSGTTLASWSFSSLPAYTGSDCCPLQTETFLSGPLLTAGTTYWLVVAPGGTDTAAVWMGSSTGGPNPLDFYSGSWNTTTGPAVAFDVQGSQVPEPSSMLLLATGLAGIGRKLLGRKRLA